jgi:cyanophycinase-like exopeptidase
VTRDFALGAGHHPLSEMTADFLDALPQLVIRHFAERSEMGRLVSAMKKFPCQLLGM